MERILVVVNGYPRSGKDTFVDLCINYLQKKGLVGIKYSTISTCEKLAKIVGWDGIKTEKARRMLSSLKDWYTEYFDGTLYEMISLMENSNKVDVVFAMIREPSEINKIESWCFNNNYPCVTILLDGRGERHHISHSDMLVEKYDYDQIIVNDGTVESLEMIAAKFVDDIYI